VQTGPLRTALTNQEYALTEPSNVDLVEEIPDLLLSQQAYNANLTTLKTADQVMQGLLDITA
jgi:flagellar hook protein FlgE